MRLSRSIGFALVELVIAIVILGILAAAAIPRFISFRNDAELAAEQATIASVQSGVQICHAAEQARK